MANKTERLIDPRGWQLVQLTALHGRWARYTEAREGSWTRQHATDAWRCRQIRDMRRTDRMQDRLDAEGDSGFCGECAGFVQQKSVQRCHCLHLATAHFVHLTNRREVRLVTCQWGRMAASGATIEGDPDRSPPYNNTVGAEGHGVLM